MHLSFPDWVMQVTDILAQHNHLAAFVISVLLAGTIGVSCGEISNDQKKKIDEALKDSLVSTTESWDVDMEIIENGVKKVRVQGSYAATYATRERNETHIRGPVYIHVFDSLSNIKTRVQSDRAIYRTKEAEFELFGDVQVDTDDNRHLESEYLMWDQNDNSISTPRFVIVTTPTDSIAGTGFEGTTDLTNYTIRNPRGRVIYD